MYEYHGDRDRLRCFCNVSTWLSWILFPRISFPMCFWLGLPTRKNFVRFGRQKWNSSHVCSLNFDVGQTLLQFLHVFEYLGSSWTYGSYCFHKISFSNFLKSWVLSMALMKKDKYGYLDAGSRLVFSYFSCFFCPQLHVCLSLSASCTVTPESALEAEEITEPRVFYQLLQVYKVKSLW